MQWEKSGMKEYKAIVWIDEEPAGKRISLLAETLVEARQKLLSDYGPNAKISLWNEDDANRLRASE